MKISPAGLDLIRAFEGLRLAPYQDVAGVWTVGYGHTGVDVVPGNAITLDEADRLLAADVARFERAVDRLVMVPLTQNQFDALVSFAFNVGEGALASSTLLRKLNAGDYAGAADEFLRWNRAADEVIPGLTERRSDERALFLRGASPAPVAPDIAPQPDISSPVYPKISTGGETYGTDAPQAPPMPNHQPTDENAPGRVLEAPMTPLLSAILPSLVSAVPELSKLFGSGSEVAQRNAAAMGVIFSAAKQATSAVNEQQAAERIAADPAAKQAFQAAVRDRWFEIDQAAERSVQAAREHAKTYRGGGTMRDGMTFIELLSLLFVVLSAAGGGYVLVAGEFPPEIRGAVITLMLIGGWTGVKEFWFGSSVGSQRKTDLMSR